MCHTYKNDKIKAVGGLGTMKILKLSGMCFLGVLCFGAFQHPIKKELNRPHFKHKHAIPPIPAQSKTYLNVVNYNMRFAYPGHESVNNEWKQRSPFFFEALHFEDEANKLMAEMQKDLQDSISAHLPTVTQSNKQEIDEDCTTCQFSSKEPFPICETEYFRIAIKVGFDQKKKCVYGNFPYPYRLMIALKRHAPRPNQKEWGELCTILEKLETTVAADLGAEYTSYACLQDVYHKNKKNGKKVPQEPHYFVHFVFRFPDGKKVGGVQFEDPNPYDQFQFYHPHLIKEGEAKASSNYIYKKMPDIINTQEVTYAQAQDLKKEMPLHNFVGYTAYDGTCLDHVKPDDWIEELVVIGYRSDRFTCMESGVRWLSRTPKVPSKCDGASRNRIIVWAKLRDIETGRQFYMFNTHYDHLGPTKIMVDAEIKIIKSIAQDHLWFAAGERFYNHHNGQDLYQHYLDTICCKDVRDASVMGHYGEAGSWGGFEDDPFACEVKDGDFACDTLDNIFTNAKGNEILLSYALSGAYDPVSKELYHMKSSIKDDYRLASDHFMTGFYALLN